MLLSAHCVPVKPMRELFYILEGRAPWAGVGQPAVVREQNNDDHQGTDSDSELDSDAGLSDVSIIRFQTDSLSKAMMWGYWGRPFLRVVANSDMADVMPERLSTVLGFGQLPEDLGKGNHPASAGWASGNLPNDEVPLNHGWDGDTFMLAGESGDEPSLVQYPPAPGQATRDRDELYGFPWVIAAHDEWLPPAVLRLAAARSQDAVVY